jgi:hypothetical protein
MHGDKESVGESIDDGDSLQIGERGVGLLRKYGEERGKAVRRSA